jgi:hypothetical protein
VPGRTVLEMRGDFNRSHAAIAQLSGHLGQAQVVQVAHGLLNHPGHQEEAALHGRGTALVGVAVVGFGDQVVAQSQGDVLHGCHGVGKRLDALGIDRPHLLDQVEKSIELAKHALTLL